METISLKMAKLESLLIENRKFAKQWLKNLKNHENDCPCKLNNYTNISIAYNNIIENRDKPCPFNLRQYGKSCFHCLFADFLNNKPYLRYYHLKSVIKSTINSAKLTWMKKNQKV